MINPAPLEAIISEMNGCVVAGLPLAGISLAVALPSVCASLSMEDGRAVGKDYTDWCEANLYPDKGFDDISPNELLSLRNGFVHQNRSELKNNKNGKLEKYGTLDRVVFSISRGPKLTNCLSVTDGVSSYLYSAITFCENMGKAAMTWLETQTDNDIVASNLEKIATYQNFMGVKAIY